MTLERWLAARDAATLRSAWTALAPRRHELARPHRALTEHGAALLAGAMLGARADWLVEPGPRTPVFTIDRASEGSFLDDAWDLRDRCRESWCLYERRDGLRGVQLVIVSAGTLDGRPEGGSISVVRVFDRDRAASVVLGANRASTIGDVDLAPLDLVRFSQPFEIASASEPLETLRGFLALFASELDARYDVSPAWPRMHAPDDPVAVERFGDAAHSISIHSEQGTYSKLTAEAHGLPWGHRLAVSIQATRGYVYGQLPDADIDRVLARLAAATQR